MPTAARKPVDIVMMLFDWVIVQLHFSFAGYIHVSVTCDVAAYSEMSDNGNVLTFDSLFASLVEHTRLFLQPSHFLS